MQLVSFGFKSEVYIFIVSVSGICDGISAGTHTITYAVGKVDNFDTPDAFIGWQSSFHIFVEELGADLVQSCDSTSELLDCSN